MDAFARLVRSLERAGVRFVLIGLAGANYYARSGATLFVTKDRDLLLPLDPDNALAAWGVCEAMGSSSGAGGNHSIDPATAFSRNAWSRTAPSFARATVRASTWISASSWPAWISKRSGRSAGFFVGTVDIPVARLGHIIESKRRVGREKDRMFLATHAEAIRDLTDSDERFESKRPRSSRRRKPRISRRRRPQ